MSTNYDNVSDDLSLLPIMAQQSQVDPVTTAGLELRAKLDLQISAALAQTGNELTHEIAQTILHEFVMLFGRLNLIESNLHKLDTLLENLSILELMQFEIRSLLDFIQEKAAGRGIGAKLLEVLDGISYGISHDLKRIFERELLGCAQSQSVPVVYGKILHAHGLLSNCFQQSTITLLQILNPAMDPLTIFNDTEERLRQSLELCKDLSSLLRMIQQSETDLTPESCGSVVERIMEFRDSSMQYLMYRDWREFERLALEVITAVDNNRDSKDIIHQFGCYLEVLYSNVKMRAVLRDTFARSEEGELSEN